MAGCCWTNSFHSMIKLSENFYGRAPKASIFMLRFVRQDMGVRGTKINNSPILLVFQLVFCVASKDTYFNMLPLMRLEYELKSCAIFVKLFSSVPLTWLAE